ncbi:MAG TPA: cache domain-containing protein [Candidatus Competibacteraceae bacterium]|nr:MAG: calcium:proton antiporter [Candidatus Competibacteraceae bacterium]HOB60962.1 cache domain-containing protein [Candidatus Competibacteraceae bacterium]HQA25593.1 cache domain-containing protein [Candidatus Competibacteraceae bacterium]HQD57667.1 cache domain-containing protein [Candidatus Competibacteraceae bacterium]
MNKLLLGVAACCAVGLSAGAWAADAATADEVVSKVKEAATAVKASSADVVLSEFDKKDGKWAWKDTYVFVLDCEHGVVKAHPSEKVKGIKVTELKDKATGQEFGTALCNAAKSTHGGWVEYMWTKPGAEGNHRKVAYILSAGNYQVAAGVYDDKLTAKELEAKSAQ